MTFAQFIGNGSTGIIGVINTIVIPVIFALVFLVFIWGVANYLLINGGNEDKRAEGRQFILWGILGMVVLFSVWGFVNLLLSTLGIHP
ncbi:hypothetical protein HKL94_01610 [Candidatus Parcubacteria bacterium]|nr:hypothetical protein [Candidatus Parcubacteria bacterium]